jgi:hypothetical protein
MSAFSFFDSAHWQKVRAERKRLGLSNPTKLGEPVKHALLNQILTDVSTGVSYVVESVRHDWYRGWFLAATLSCQGSHRVCFIENKSCVDDAILQQIDLFSTTFKPA